MTWRRVLLFTVMVALGLVVVLVLADEQQAGQRARIETAAGDAPREQSLVLKEQGLRFRFEDMEIDVLQPVEVEPGRFEDRPAWRVEMARGEPDPSGEFVAHEPTVWLVDPASGLPNGSVRADVARFQLDEAVGGDLNLEMGALRAQRFRLLGAVHGEFPLGEGLLATLDCEELRVDGTRLSAPGDVTWRHQDLALSGRDMRWDDDQGRLDLALDAHVVIEAGEAHVGLDLFAPAGLTLSVPPGTTDVRNQALLELRGGVSGATSAGTQLGAHTLNVDGPAGRLVLNGQSVVEDATGNEQLKVTAQHIDLVSDGQGGLGLAEADGDVYLVSQPFAVVPSWMVSDSLRLEDGRLQADGTVRWGREGLVASGDDGLSYDQAEGVLESPGPSEIAVEAGSGLALEGLALVAPGGMTWHLPPDAVDPLASGTGELRGGVHGTLSDGTAFEADLLLFDGPSGTFTLQGGSHVSRVGTAGGESLRAETLRLTTDGSGQLALISANGAVELLSGDVELLPTRVLTERLDLTRVAPDDPAVVAQAPEVVVWSQGEFSVVGVGMHWDEGSGRLELLENARLTWHVPGGKELTLFGSGGLVASLPRGALRPLDQGRAELRGPVLGTASDGSQLQADTLLLDGPTGTLTLLGSASLSWQGRGAPLALASERIELATTPEGSRVAAPEAASWSHGDMQGTGEGLTWDEAQGTLAIARGASLAAPALELSAGEGLAWRAPPDSTTPLADGTGELRGGVTGASAGGRFSAQSVDLRGQEGLELRENASFEHTDADGSVRLVAREAIAVRSDAQGQPAWLQATGDARIWARPAGGTAHDARGDALVWDRAAGTSEVVGHAVVASEQLRVSAADRIVLTSDEDGSVRSIAALGGVDCATGEYQLHGDELLWDVAGDRLNLAGDCRLFALGAWMSAAELRLRPRAEEFEILRSVIRAEDQP